MALLHRQMAEIRPGSRRRIRAWTLNVADDLTEKEQDERAGVAAFL